MFQLVVVVGVFSAHTCAQPSNCVDVGSRVLPPHDRSSSIRLGDSCASDTVLLAFRWVAGACRPWVALVWRLRWPFALRTIAHQCPQSQRRPLSWRRQPRPSASPATRPLQQQAAARVASGTHVRPATRCKRQVAPRSWFLAPSLWVARVTRTFAPFPASCVWFVMAPYRSPPHGGLCASSLVSGGVDAVSVSPLVLGFESVGAYLSDDSDRASELNCPLVGDLVSTDTVGLRLRVFSCHARGHTTEAPRSFLVVRQS